MNPAADQPTNFTMPQSAPAAPGAANPQNTGVLQAASSVAAPDPAQLEAADSELIEKEWVDKAKQIVEQTKGDPYEQNRQLARIRAEYLQKRYGKTIKLTE